MKQWNQSLRDALLSGSIASVLSTLMLSVRGQQEVATPYAPTNATSQWIYGEQAAYHDGPSLQHTVTGYAIHHASSIFWAIFYERWFGERAEHGDIVPAFADGMTVAALACFTDYNLTPRRLRPGFEKRLSMRSLWLAYASVGVGFAIRGLAQYYSQRRLRS